jgi:GDPmannose 4,6-dehydratase
MLYRKRALIFGIYGQDGSYLAHFLNTKNYKVFGTSRKIKKCLNFKKLNLNNKLTVLRVNPANAEEVKSVIKKTKCNEIYYFSGISSVNESFCKPFETLNVNTNGLFNILESCRELNFKGKIYNAGSSECFGNSTKKINELTPFNPVSPYGLSKVICHYLIKSYRENFGLWCCTGFAFNHESLLRTENFIFIKIINAAKKIANNQKQRLRLGDINISRDWGWAPEFVEIFWKILQLKKPDDFIIGTGEKKKLKDIISYVFRSYNLNYKKYLIFEKKFLRKNDIKQNCANNYKLLKTLKLKEFKKYNFVIDKILKNKIF